jgi:hypothetical protein
MLNQTKANFLHRSFTLKALLLLMFCTLSTSSLFAQTNKKKAKVNQKDVVKKNDASEIDLSKVEWPAYYTEYASGGDFRNGRDFSVEEKYQAPYILSVPVIFTSSRDQALALKMWKETVRIYFKGTEQGIYKPVDPSTSNEVRVVNHDGLDMPESSYGGDKPSTDIPFWVNDYLNDDELFNRLFSFQVSLGNVIYCSEDIMFPLMTNANLENQEDRIEEGKKYYSAIYAWAKAYPKLFDKIDDPNLKTALQSQNIDLLYRFGQHRFALSNTMRDSLRFEKKKNQP